MDYKKFYFSYRDYIFDNYGSNMTKGSLNIFTPCYNIQSSNFKDADGNRLVPFKAIIIPIDGDSLAEALQALPLEELLVDLAAYNKTAEFKVKVAVFYGSEGARTGVEGQLMSLPDAIILKAAADRVLNYSGDAYGWEDGVYDAAFTLFTTDDPLKKMSEPSVNYTPWMPTSGRFTSNLQGLKQTISNFNGVDYESLKTIEELVVSNKRKYKSPF